MLTIWWPFQVTTLKHSRKKEALANQSPKINKPWLISSRDMWVTLKIKNIKFNFKSRIPKIPPYQKYHKGNEMRESSIWWQNYLWLNLQKKLTSLLYKMQSSKYRFKILLGRRHNLFSKSYRWIASIIHIHQEISPEIWAKKLIIELVQHFQATFRWMRRHLPRNLSKPISQRKLTRSIPLAR